MQIIDLFSGCGGLSLGFEWARFMPMFSIERDLWASETYSFNNPSVKVIIEDIKKIDNPIDIIEKGIIIDGIIGSPPCQGFSLSGNRDSKDPRNSLFMDFVRFVKIIQPLFFVMENVTGILSMKTGDGYKVCDIIRDKFKDAGFKLCMHVLNAADYGVPQLRKRVFFIGIQNGLPLNSAMLKPISILRPMEYVSLIDAISDLPQLNAGEGEKEQTYKMPFQNKYQFIMRKGSSKIYNHIAMRHTERLITRFSKIKCGQSVADMPPEYSQRMRGDAKKISGKAFSQNNMRPLPNKPCPTVAASFQSNFIHPLCNRNFTAREGARIQSFPDSYVFKGKRTTMSWEKNLSQYQQIGNAVPPLMAKAIAERIKWYFNNISTIKDDFIV